MRKALKRFLLALSAVIALLAVAVVGGYFYLSSRDAEQTRRLLESTLESGLGRDVRLAGPLEITLWPLPAITIGDVAIANADWGTEPQMIRVDSLHLRPHLAKLLVGKIELYELVIQGARVFLENGPDGRGNWQFDLDASDDSQELPVRIRSIAIRDLHAAYLHQASGEWREIDLDRFTLRADNLRAAVRLDLSGRILDQPLTVAGSLGKLADLMAGRPFPLDLTATVGETSLSLRGQIDDPDFRDFAGIHLRLEATGHQPVVLMGWTSIAIPPLDAFNVAGDIEGTRGRLGLDNLEARFSSGEYQLSLAGSVRHLPKLQGMALDFDAHSTKITQLLPWEDRERTLTGEFAARGRLSGDLNDPRLEPVTLTADLAGARLELDGTLKEVSAGGIVDATIRLQTTDAGGLASAINIPMPGVDVLDFRGRLVGTLAEPGLRQIDARLSEGSIQARVTGQAAGVAPVSGVDLNFDGSGTDFSDLEEILGVEGLPVTDRVTVTGRLRGDARDLALELADSRLTQGDLVLHTAGTIGDLLDAPNLDLAMDLAGANLRDLETIAQTELPATERFHIDGELVGAATRPDLEDVDVVARLPGIEVRLLHGRFPDVLEFKRFDARVEAEGDDLSRLGREFGQDWPASKTFRITGRSHGSIEAPKIVDLSGTLTSDDIDLSLSGAVEDMLAGKGFDLEVHATDSLPTAFLPFGGYLWDALGRVNADFSLKGDIDRFDAVVQHLEAGRSKVQGRFTYTLSPDGDIRQIEGAFQESTLDLTPWLKLGEEPGEADAASRQAQGAPVAPLFSDRPIPLGWMKGLELEVDLSSIVVTFGSSQLELVIGGVNLAREILSIDPFQLRYEDARIDGRVTMQGGDSPRLTLQSRTRGLDLGRLLRQAGISNEARGLIDLQLDYSVVGTSPSEMAGTTDGQITLLMTEGFVAGTDIPLHFGNMLLHLMPWARERAGMTIECAMLDAPIRQGIADIRLFVLDTPDMLMRGKGKVDLGGEKYDLLLVPRAKRARALAHKVDVRVSGPLGNPSISYDAAAAGLSALETAGRFAILGPAGLFVSSDSLRRNRQECAESLEQMTAKQ